MRLVRGVFVLVPGGPAEPEAEAEVEMEDEARTGAGAGRVAVGLAAAAEVALNSCLGQAGAYSLALEALAYRGPAEGLTAWLAALPTPAEVCILAGLPEEEPDNGAWAVQFPVVLRLALGPLSPAGGLGQPPAAALAQWSASAAQRIARCLDADLPAALPVLVVAADPPAPAAVHSLRAAGGAARCCTVTHRRPDDPDLLRAVLALPLRHAAVFLHPAVSPATATAVRRAALHRAVYCDRLPPEGLGAAAAEQWALVRRLWQTFGGDPGQASPGLAGCAAAPNGWAFPPALPSPPPDPRHCLAALEGYWPSISSHTEMASAVDTEMPHGDAEMMHEDTEMMPEYDMSVTSKCFEGGVLAAVAEADWLLAGPAPAWDLRQQLQHTALWAVPRTLGPTSARRPYASSEAEPLAVEKGLHFGQRKLLLSEVEFLTAWFADHPAAVADTLCVYAGAADGRHLPLLFAMFPFVRWVLADPNPLHSSVTRKRFPQVVEILRDYFTDDTCRHIVCDFPTTAILLISDIRGGDPLSLASEQNTARITADNEAQAHWVRLLNARRAMLKFHPPYPHMTPHPETGYVVYLRGAVHTGVWAPRSSTEVRLVVPAPAPVLPPGSLLEVDEKTATAPGPSPGPVDDGGAWEAERPLCRPVAYHCKAFEEHLYHYNTAGRFAADVLGEARILAVYALLHRSFPPALAASVARAVLGAGAGVGKPPAVLTAAALSDAVSRALDMPDFRPLSPDFPEMAARFWYFARSLQRARPPNRLSVGDLAAVARELAALLPDKAALLDRERVDAALRRASGAVRPVLAKVDWRNAALRPLLRDSFGALR